MSQHDYNIANGGGAAVRADINNALLAILSQNSGATAPTVTKPFMFWFDTTTNVLKMRNAADTAWVAAIDGVTGGNPQGLKNRIINGAMMIDQRNAGASFTPTVGGQYTLDRWQAQLSVTSKYSVQQNAGSVTPPAGFTKYLGVTSLSAYSVGSSDYFALRHIVEGFNVADLAWGTASAASITISFWVRSSLTGTFGGTLQNVGSNRFYAFTYSISSANTWEYKTITVAGDTSGTWATDNTAGLMLTLGLGVGSTYSVAAGSWGSTACLSATGANSVVGTNGATFYITGVQLEKGSTATSFDYRPYGTELALCQRYYQKMQAFVTLAGSNGRVALPCTQISMRSTPSATSDYIFNTESGSTTIATPTYAGVSLNGSGYTTQTTGGGGATMSTINGITWSAEL